MHMFGGSGQGAPLNQGSPPPGGHDQEAGYGGGQPMMGGPPGGAYQPVGGHPAPGPGGFPGQPQGYPGAPPPQGYPGGAAPPAYTRMSSTNPMNLIWFAAACSVMFGALLSMVAELFSFEWVDALEMGYLFLFGMLLAVLDTPLFNQMQIVAEIRVAIGKYIAVLQRVTGKGATYIFLGCALWSSMFANVESGVLLFFAVLISLFVTFIGIFSVAIAYLKSRNLDLVRKEFQKDQGQSLKQLYDQYAKMSPTVGLTQQEFKALTPMARGVQFEMADIKLIFNALSSHPRREVISIDDLSVWVNGGMMVFI